jgi:aminomethyltransferase
VTIEDVTESLAALALQGPFSRAVLEAASGEGFADLRYFRRRGTTIAGVAVDVSRTGYTGDLGYELWIPADGAPAVWDALFEAGKAYAIRPAGMIALDVTRLEAGLIMLDVDYTSARHAMNPEQSYSPYEIGLGKLVSFDKADYVGRRALQAEHAKGGPDRRLVGLMLDWYDIEKLYDDQGLPPAISPSVDRSPVPVFADGHQVGKSTSHGWSPILKQALALAYVPARYERVGTKLQVEWTVEGRRGRVSGTVVELPFLDLDRKRA